MGQVYERIEGSPMADLLLGTTHKDLDEVDRLARIFAKVHVEVHARGSIPEVPPTRQIFPQIIRRIDILPPALQEATVAALDKLPVGEQLCHGDFHPYNVIMNPKGAVIIDWNNAHIGNPLEDIARSILILEGVGVSTPSIRPVLDRFAQVYLERYFELSSADRGQLAAWRPIVAAVRLADNMSEIQEWLLAQIRAGLGVQA
jgi:aminoglycoside phosphotransferase (APT) family kinase protein